MIFKLRHILKGITTVVANRGLVGGLFTATYLKGHSTTTWTEFCPFLTPSPPYPPVRGQFLYHERGQKQIFFDSLPHHLVHVVIECPLIMFEIGTVRAPSLVALD